MHSSRLGTGLLALALALSAAVLVPAADADPGDPSTPSAADVQAAQDRAGHALSAVDRVRQQLADATAEADAADHAAARAYEAWNGARWRATEARRAERRAERRSARAEAARKAQQADYRKVVLTVAHGQLGLNAANAMITADGMDTLLDREAAGDHIQALFDQQRDAYTRFADQAAQAQREASSATDRATAALDEARTAKAAADSAAGQARAVAATIAARRTHLVRKLARLQGVSTAVAARRQAALEAEAARSRAAAAEAAAAAKAGAAADAAAQASTRHAGHATHAAVKPKPTVAVPDRAPAPDSGGAAKAIAFARAQIGEPYVWGAEGPDSWDCSGLTAGAWAAGGKSLPHYSVAQYEQSTPISAGQLRPGDLLFWSDGGPGEIFHVALYSGNGQMIQAPRTGRPVVEESMYSWRAPDFYARP